MEIKKKRNRKVSQFSGMILSNKIETPTWTKLVPGIPLIGKKTNDKVCQKICELMQFQGTLHHLHFGNKISKNFFLLKQIKKFTSLNF